MNQLLVNVKSKMKKYLARQYQKVRVSEITILFYNNNNLNTTCVHIRERERITCYIKDFLHNKELYAHTKYIIDNKSKNIIIITDK